MSGEVAISRPPEHSLIHGGPTPCPVGVKEAKALQTRVTRAGGSGEARAARRGVTLALRAAGQRPLMVFPEQVCGETYLPRRVSRRLGLLLIFFLMPPTSPAHSTCLLRPGHVTRTDTYNVTFCRGKLTASASGFYSLYADICRPHHVTSGDEADDINRSSKPARMADEADAGEWSGVRSGG